LQPEELPISTTNDSSTTVRNRRRNREAGEHKSKEKATRKQKKRGVTAAYRHNTATVNGNTLLHVRFSSSLFSSSPSSSSTVHVACEQWRVLHCSLPGPNQNCWAGFGPVQEFPKKILSKNFVIFPHIFFYQFHVILVCIFIL